eukprot:Rhum_TRINITY_DN19579_c0_g1::Rhum_TRINITY_DN19579_c0_g1_i1::g.170261::m.170261
MEQLTDADDLRDFLRRARIAPTVVNSLWRRGVSGAALCGMDATALSQLGVPASQAARLLRLRALAAADPGCLTRLSPSHAAAAAGLADFYRSVGLPEKAAAAEKIVGSHADDPTLLHKALLARYPEMSEGLGFLRALVAEHAERTARLSDLTRRLHTVFRSRGITHEDPQELVEAYGDAPWLLLDHLMQTYLVRASEVVFLSDWCTEVDRSEIEERAQADTAAGGGGGAGSTASGPPPPPPPDGEPPDWAIRSVVSGGGVGGGGGGGGGDASEMTRLRCLLASCKAEIKRQKAEALEAHAASRRTLKELHAANKARHEDAAELHELRMRVASLEKVAEHKDALLLRMAQGAEVGNLQTRLQSDQEAVVRAVRPASQQASQAQALSPRQQLQLLQQQQQQQARSAYSG